ncbi:methyl farnesoate epoxidase-like [Ischnura elegans]|uniref:methyl farnesoate epoxidase-like n=1 Tax=Ischnura elegans TaxID=197161 RepID=UPI001ED876E7|nr:methyl farnesoate epoxidase-like [Ischnura elegans]XP_046394816.1 methyl farnesoate epoxidase-like [Ischnura elegans]XP_046394817.1 methyl farnesoate epoxidase-like [Ischnura elegans]XP_046394818.1 methyl farnesoate epoxidase-like [Ischnura elegans]XP_046394819.1 methyl farnesoate epoxidase-like [Ischnura elegans]
MDITTIILVATVLLLLWSLSRKPKNFPPGPIRLPLIGNLSVFMKPEKFGEKLEVMYQKYGEICGTYTFHMPVVIVSGVEAVREVCYHEDLVGRPENAFQKIVYGKSQGILHNTGEEWKSLRRFTLQHLRDLGFGKSSLEGLAHEELLAVFNDIDEISGGRSEGFPNPVNFHDVLGGASINVLWHILAGKRYEHRDPKFKQLITAVQKLLIVFFQITYLYNIVPSLAKVFPRITGFETMESHIKPIEDFIQDEIDDHKKDIDYDHPRDFIDIFLAEVEKQKNNQAHIFNEQQLKQICIELYVAGTDTTLNTLSFAILFMILYPEKQEKVQQELDDVVGRDRLPSLNDRARLPYVEATLNEVFRLSSIIPASLPRTIVSNKEYITLRGYHIPKGSLVAYNIHSLHHDPKIWDSPEEFIPERFLDKSKKTPIRDVLLPFGAGKRACLGESLARNNFFLFFTGLLQRYSLRVPDGQPKPSTEPLGVNVTFPKPFTVKVQLRT